MFLLLNCSEECFVNNCMCGIFVVVFLYALLFNCQDLDVFRLLNNKNNNKKINKFKLALGIILGVEVLLITDFTNPPKFVKRFQ